MNTPTVNEDFLRLIDENKAIIFKICNTYCNNKSDREDLAQEIIYQLWRSVSRFDPAYTFSTWMYRIALNVAISFYRKEKRTAPVIPLTEHQRNISDTEHSNDESDDFKRLQEFIAGLKDLDKALVILYLEAKSYAEIADVLGISETNVATRINRIKTKMKQKFSTINR